MKRIETTFNKNDLIYEMVDRTEDVGLFKLFINESWMDEPEHCGWEVCLINYHPEFTIKGVVYQEGESLSSNDEFGADGSKAFFPSDEKEALEYFYRFNLDIQSQKVLKLTDK